MFGQFATGKLFAIVATGSYVGEGFDDDRLDALFLAGPVSWSGLVAQYVGRLQRRHGGKNEVVVYDYADANVRMLDRMSRKRLKGCAAQGYELRPATDVGDVRGEFVTPESYLERFELDVVKAAKALLIASSEVHKRCVSRSSHAWRRRCRVEWSCRRPCPIPRMQSRRRRRRSLMPPLCSCRLEPRCRSAKSAPISWWSTVP